MSGANDNPAPDNQLGSLRALKAELDRLGADPNEPIIEVLRAAAARGDERAAAWLFAIERTRP